MSEEVITSLPEDFVREFEDEVLGKIPEERLQVGMRQAQIARIMKQAGSAWIPGVGQKVAEIDPRLYFRMMHSFGKEENWLQDFLADNPELCAPGYRPRSSSLRHSKSFVAGAPV